MIELLTPRAAFCFCVLFCLRQCLKIRDLREEEGVTNGEDGAKAKTSPHGGGSGHSMAPFASTSTASGQKKNAKLREEELATITDTVNKFLDRNTAGHAGSHEYLTTSVEMISNLADSFYQKVGQS